MFVLKSGYVGLKILGKLEQISKQSISFLYTFIRIKEDNNKQKMNIKGKLIKKLTICWISKSSLTLK